MTSNKAKEIERLVEKSGIVDSVGYEWRCLDVTDMLVKQIKEFRPISMVIGQCFCPFWFPKGHWWLYKEKSGDQVLEQSTHVFDPIRFLTGGPTRICTEVDNIFVKRAVPDMTSEDQLDCDAQVQVR